MTRNLFCSLNVGIFHKWFHFARTFAVFLLSICVPQDLTWCFDQPMQENCKNEEILMSLKYVRPGNGFEPKFQLLEKVDVNGKDAHPLFLFLREALPFPSDEPAALISDPKLIIWSPVCRNDVAWNFEKFLIGPDGVPFKRYSRRFLTSDIEGDIKKLLNQAN